MRKIGMVMIVMSLFAMCISGCEQGAEAKKQQEASAPRSCTGKKRRSKYGILQNECLSWSMGKCLKRIPRNRVRSDRDGVSAWK